MADAAARAGGKPYVVLIGDSIAHGDGYGRPSETLGAQLDRAIPTANLSSPSLAFKPQREILHHVLSTTDAPLVLVQINLKWVSHEWTPEKFESILEEIGREGNARHFRLKDFLLMREAKLKAHYRLTNFTLREFGANGFQLKADGLWSTELRQESKPDYAVESLDKVTAEHRDSLAPYHRLSPADIARCAELNALIEEMRAAKGRVLALLIPFNADWARSLAPDVTPGDNLLALAAELKAAGVRTVVVDAGAAGDYRDDMHLTVAGAAKAARQIAAAVESPQ